MTIAFIAPIHYVESLRLIGFRCFPAETADIAGELIKEIKAEYDAILISEDYGITAADGVIPVPGLVIQAGSDYLKKQVQRAIGSEVSLFDK